MRGSIRELEPGVYQLRVYVGRRPDGGKRYTGRVYRGGKRAAEKALRDLIAQVEEERERATDPEQSVRGWLERWRDRNASSWSPTTLARADGVIENDLAELGALPLVDLRPADVQAWADGLVERGLAPATVRRSFGVLRAGLEDAARLEVLLRNPAARVSLPRLRRREFPEVPAELLERALCATDPHLRALVRIAAATGGRRGQLVGLRWSDVDLEAGTITFRRAVVKRDGGFAVKELKSGNVVRVPVDAGTVDAVSAYRRHRADQVARAGVDLAPDGYLFARDVLGRAPWYPDTATARWRELARYVGLRGVRLHDLRHAHATALIGAGVDVRTVASRLGHASPAVTLRVYSHPVSEAERKAAELTGRLLDGPATGRGPEQ